MATGEKRQDWRGVQTLARHADGRELSVEIRFSRFELDGETLFVGFMHDLTERRAAERVAAEHRRLQEADRARSEFLARMSHELRTPLNAVLGFTDLVRSGHSGPVTPEQVRQLGFVSGAGRQLLALIDDLLTLSRIDAGRLALRIQPLDLARLITEVADGLRPQATACGMTLTLAVPATLPWRGDHDKLAQVLQHLVGHALRSAARGDVQISAQLAGHSLVLAVRDHGPGVPEAQRALLFQPFQPLEGGVAPAQEGTGLGLYLSAQLLGLMNGSVHHEAPEDGGSRFVVELEPL